MNYKFHRFARCRTALLALGVAIWSVSGLAEVSATFTGVNGAVAFGYYVGPYTGTLDGLPITLYCVDFAHDVFWNEHWDANLTPLDTPLSNTRFGSVPDAQVLYLEAAWLTTQYNSNPNDMGDIQATIWQLFDSAPNTPTPSGNYWLNLAEQNYTTIDPQQFVVVTNVSPDDPASLQVQEFLSPADQSASLLPSDPPTSDPPTSDPPISKPVTSAHSPAAPAVPEPASIVMLLTIVLVVAGAGRRRRIIARGVSSRS